MDRSKFDPFWNDVVNMNDGSMTCEFCEYLFAKGTSISRIKWHLSGEKGHGVAICGQVPKYVQEAAILAMRAGNKRPKTIASSSILVEDAEWTQMAAFQGTEQGVGEGRTSPRAEVGNHMENMAGEMMHIDTGITAERLTVDADELGGEAGQTTDSIEKHQGVGVELSRDIQGFMHGFFAGDNETDEGGCLPACPMFYTLESGQWSELAAHFDNFAEDEGRIQMELRGMEQGAGDAHETGGKAPQPLTPGAPAHINSISELMLDAPETRQRTEQGRQDCESGTRDFLSLLMEDNFVTNDVENPATGLLRHFERDSVQPTGLHCLGLGRGCDQLCSLSLNNDVIMNELENMIGELRQPVVRGSSHERLQVNQDELKGDSSQPADLQCLNLGRYCDQHCTPSVNNDVMVDDVENIVREPGQPVVRGTEQVPKAVQEAAFLAMHGGNKRQKTIASSSSVDDNFTSSCLQEENNEIDNVVGDAGRIQMAVQGSEEGVGESRTSSHAVAGNLTETMAGEMMYIDTSITAKGLVVDAHETRVENGTGGLAHPGAGASFSGGLTRNTNEIEGDALPTTKLVGQAFKDNKNTVWSWLMNDEVSSIGIYGMGGVGKTTLVTHIYKQLESSDTFRDVYWITVSQNFCINRLQNSIARSIGLGLSNEEEEQHRAVKLSEELMKRQKWVLILDELCDSFELYKVGIPVQVKGCKLILTTRSEKICQQMDTQKKIKVNPLLEEEAWTLFMEKLGHDITLSFEVKEIAQSITEECEGLPLRIVTMARAMKGVVEIDNWRNALMDLKQSRVRQDDMLLWILRLSYKNLRDSALQQCFLYCSLYHEDMWIRKVDLIAYLIDEGVINNMESREAEFDKGHSMLNTLVNVCLLESDRWCQNGGYVGMNNLTRDMAIQIHQENSQVMVKAKAQLKELPDAKEWTENLERVSLMENQIEEILSNYSPRCPNLSTLLLCSNRNMRFIADSFFKDMRRLKVLDLSHTNIENLPDSVSDLVSLISLLLSYCKKLRHVPSLKKLRELKRLDLFYTALEKIPQDMECLSELRYLRLNGCGQKEFPSGILPELSHLQVLVIEELGVDGKYAPVTVKGKEVACLRKLENLQCHFEGHSDFVEYLKCRDKIQALSTYKLFIGQLDEDDYDRMKGKFRRNKCVGLGNFSVNRDGDFQFMLPNDIQELVICAIKSSLEVSSLINHATELVVIRIWNCNSIKSLVSSSWFCSAPLPSPSNGIFSGLKEFYCGGCASIKKLFPLVLLPNLVNMEVISVKKCEKMEIVATRDEEEVMGEDSSSCYFNVEFNLPKLRILKLKNLPELKGICSAKLICDSLEEIRVRDCPKLKRIPICLPLLDNGQPSPHSL